MGIRPLRIFAVHKREKVRVRASWPLWKHLCGDGRRRKQTTGTRKKTAAKRGRSRREFFPPPSSAPEGSFFATPIGENRFLHTLSVTDGEKIVFGTRSRLRTGNNLRSHAAASPKRNLCIFPITDGEKLNFCTRYRLRTRKPTRAVGSFLAVAFACPPSAAFLPDRTEAHLQWEKKTLEREVFPHSVGVHFSFFSCENT